MKSTSRQAIRKYFEKWIAFYTRVTKSELLTSSAALAFNSILGVVPILGLVFWYLSSIHLTERWLDQTKRFILTQLNVAAIGPFLSTFDKFTSNISSGGWGIAGIAFLVYTAWSLVTQFGNAIDNILETAEHPPAIEIAFWEVALRRLFILFWLPISITISVAGTEWIAEDSWLRYLFHLPLVGGYLAGIVAWTVGIITYCLVYKYVPRRQVPWKQALKAGVIVGPSLELVRFLFGWYTKHAVSTQKLYGVFAVIPLFILWIQLGWLLLLFGALFIQVKRKEPSQDS